MRDFFGSCFGIFWTVVFYLLLQGIRHKNRRQVIVCAVIAASPFAVALALIAYSYAAAGQAP